MKKHLEELNKLADHYYGVITTATPDTVSVIDITAYCQVLQTIVMVKSKEELSKRVLNE